MAAPLILDNMTILDPSPSARSTSEAGDVTPTCSSPNSDEAQTQGQPQEPPVDQAPIPVFLQRLMADYARQLRRAQGHTGADDGSSATVTERSHTQTRSNTGGTISPSPQPNSAQVSLGNSLASSVLADVAPLSFSALASNGASSSLASATAPPLTPLTQTKQIAPPAPTPAPSSVAIQTTTNTVSASLTPLAGYTPNRRLENVYSPPALIAPEEDLLPPDNFAMVSSFIYRSSFPKKKNFPFLKSLGLKSVLTLILEDYPDANAEFLEKEGIKFFQFGIPGNKEPFVQIPEDKIVGALALMLDTRNHPMLIHCNKGKHRTGCLVGCLRKVQQWSLTQIFSEYRLYSYPKSRSMDQQFIEAFDSLPEVWAEVDGRYLPSWALPTSTGM